MTAVAFIGLGSMGSRMAGRLLDADNDLIVWNRTRAKAEPLIDAGARIAQSPADAASQADVVITMVTDPQALQAVTQGPEGIIAGVRDSATLIEMSTVGPEAVSRLASALHDRVGILDAPVLGSLGEAESGSLTIFVGGSTSTVERVTPLLSALGSLIHVGQLGAGATAKLVANSTLFSTLATLGEAIALGQALGLTREATYRVLAATPLAAQAERRRGAIETGEYPRRFPLSLARKDASLINEAAVAADVDLRLTKAAEAWLTEADEAGLGGQDYSAVLATILSGRDDNRSRPRTTAATALHVFGSGGLECDAFIVDLDGVIWRGDDPIDGAAEAIAAVRANGSRVLFLTNEPGSSRAAFAVRLTEMGIPAASADVMTSAAATARVMGSLEGLTRRRAFVVGPPALHDEIKGAGFHLVTTEEARDAEVVVVGAHRGFDYTELRAATFAIRNGARLFATGRDAVFPTPNGPWPGTGAILAAIETAGGASAVVVGKPEPVMFDIAREALSGCERVCVIGDHLITDIAGAKGAGLTAILVLTGVTRQADLEHAMIPPDLVLESLAALPGVMKMRS